MDAERDEAQSLTRDDLISMLEAGEPAQLDRTRSASGLRITAGTVRITGSVVRSGIRAVRARVRISS